MVANPPFIPPNDCMVDACSVDWSDAGGVSLDVCIGLLQIRTRLMLNKQMEDVMSTTLLIIIVVLLVLGGGGWGYSRWRR